MAKTYRIKNDKIEKSDKTVITDNIEKSVEDIEKSVEILGGTGEWKQLHGIKLLVDPSGTVIKGPDIMIGRKFDDLERLTFGDTNTVMLSVARATMATNKSYEDDIDKKLREEEMQKAVKLLDEAIERGKIAERKLHERQKFI